MRDLLMHICTTKLRVVWTEKTAFRASPRCVWLPAGLGRFVRPREAPAAAIPIGPVRHARPGARADSTRDCAHTTVLSTMLSTGVHRPQRGPTIAAQSPVPHTFAAESARRKGRLPCTVCPHRYPPKIDAGTAVIFWSKRSAVLLMILAARPSLELSQAEMPVAPYSA